MTEEKEQYVKMLIFVVIALLIAVAVWGVLVVIQPRSRDLPGANILELMTFEVKMWCSTFIPGC